VKKLLSMIVERRMLWIQSWIQVELPVLPWTVALWKIEWKRVSTLTKACFSLLK
jgi:hypothetical protein